ncbi:MAG: hypothetical protein RLZZ464_1774 [Pseudomonadota bacterium]|jgi:Protein of unknown function (DUF2946)
MTWTSFQLRKLSLLVLCVMLLGALAPTVSRARAWSQGAQINWTEVCTTDGARQVVVDQVPGEDRSPAPAMGMLDHCALCVLATDRMAPPVTPWVWQGLPQAPPKLAEAEIVFIQTVRHWTVHSRAPPDLS